jgi:hypothetical protein
MVLPAESTALYRSHAEDDDLVVAAKGFLQLAIGQAGRIQPRVINVDGHPPYPAQLKIGSETLE